MDKKEIIRRLKRMSEHAVYMPGRPPFIMSIDDGVAADEAAMLLKEQETIDKNTGEWKNGHCSCCGEDIASMVDTWTSVQSFHFCPNCGAEMIDL